jgi:hypothetical protein
MIKAVGVKDGFINEKLATKLGKSDVIYFYEGLKDWIKKEHEEIDGHCGCYDDLKEFYWKCKVEVCICEYKTNWERKNNKSYWYIKKPWIYCMNERERCNYICKICNNITEIYIPILKPY